jgi:hypothetical protein
MHVNGNVIHGWICSLRFVYSFGRKEIYTHTHTHDSTGTDEMGWDEEYLLVRSIRMIEGEGKRERGKEEEVKVKIAHISNSH